MRPICVVETPMAAQVFAKYLALGTGANDLNSRKLPAYFTSPSYYTPVAIGSEATTMVSAHLKGIDTALGDRLLLSGGSLTGALDINAASLSHGSSLRLVGSVKVGTNSQDASVAGNGTLRWTGDKFQYALDGSWTDLLAATVAPVVITTCEFDAQSGGQTVFTASEDLTGKTVSVYHNGQKKRLTDDYTIAGANVTFEYTIEEGEWISIEVNSALSTVFNYDAETGGQTTFTTTIDLTTKSVLVFENGQKRRLGATHDYTISGTDVVFNDAVLEGQWIQIIVF
jgi:hypothetical protein